MHNKSGSAFYGEPAYGPNDELLMEGLFGSKKPPKKVVLPPNAPESQAMGMLVGLCFAIVIVTLITGARLLVRIFRKGQKFGLDDWVIIPGAVGYPCFEPLYHLQHIVFRGEVESFMSVNADQIISQSGKDGCKKVDNRS